MTDSPEVRNIHLEECPAASGLVVVIDVCRAFTTAAYAFEAGAREIILVGTVEDALALRRQIPGSLAMGEVGGYPVAEFDFWNSPVQLSRAKLDGKTIIQRTSAGTQGVVQARDASLLLAASFTVARPTVRFIQRLAPAVVTFVITGARPDDPRYGQEDAACASYMAALLRGEEPAPASYLLWEENFIAAHELEQAPEPLRSQFLADLRLCQMVDHFPFAMVVTRRGG